MQSVRSVGFDDWLYVKPSLLNVVWRSGRLQACSLASVVAVEEGPDFALSEAGDHLPTQDEPPPASQTPGSYCHRAQPHTLVAFPSGSPMP